MVRSFVLTALVVLSLVAWTQPGPIVQLPSRFSHSDSSQQGILFKLEGTVVNVQTGKPIPHALVQLYTSSVQSVLTGSEGEFSFDKQRMGYAVIKVEKPGFFVPGAKPQMAPTQNVLVGPETGKLILKLVPESVIAGEVTNDLGEPVEGATVDVLMSQIINGRRQITWARGSVSTDEDGLFRIAGLPSGRYFLSFKAGNAERRILGAQTGKTRYPLVSYYPGVADTASATPFDLAPGQRVHAQFTLPLAPTFRLSGTVSGMADFKQVSPPMIVDAMLAPLATASRWDSQTGAYEFPPLPSGVYTIAVSAQIDDNHSSWMKQSVTLNHDVSGFNVALRAGVTIPVSVQTDFTGSPDDCSGYLSINSNVYHCGKFPAMVTLASVEGNHFDYQAEAQNGDPSVLALHSIMPGKYQIRISTMGHGYAYSARSGDTDLLREELIVPAGGNVQPIEIVLRDDQGKVKIHVHAEPMPEHVQVLLMPDAAFLDRPMTVEVPRDGDMEFNALPPGDYRVLAFESLDNIEYENPEVMEKYSAKTARISVSPQGSTNVTVELIRQGE